MSNRVSREEVEAVRQKMLYAIEGLENKTPRKLSKLFYFKGRKSTEIAENLITALSKENETVLDPFLGGGSFLFASLRAGRNIHGIELDNYTFFALEMVFTKCNKEVICEYFNKIEKNCKEEILHLYRTQCCSQDNYIKKHYFDLGVQEYFNPRENRDNKDGNIKLLYKCKACGKSKKNFDDNDLKILEESESLDTREFPQVKMMENSRINITSSTGADYYPRRFSKRNQYALLRIQKEIHQLPDSIEKQMLQHILVVILARAKVMMYGDSTDILYHIPLENSQDVNVWDLFKEKYEEFVNFKEEYQDFLVENLDKDKQFCIRQGDFQEILGGLEDAYDLIYTDFPYTDQVPYLERNQLFRIWLEKFMDKKRFALSDEVLKKEIVVTNAPKRQEKNSLESYYKDIDRMFSTLYKVLKQDRYMVITMKLGEEKYFKVYAEIINLARKNGFEFVTRVGVTKNDPTLRKQSAYIKTLMKEQIVVFKKLSSDDFYFFLNGKNFEEKIIKWTYEEIQKPLPKNLTQVVKAVKSNMEEERKLSIDSRELEQIATVIQRNFVVENGYVLMNSSKLYLSAESEETLFTKLYNNLPIYIKELLDKQRIFVLEDLYLKLTNLLCESDNAIVAQVLEDKRYTGQIEEMLSVYCDIENGHYIAKKIINERHEKKQDVAIMSGAEFEHLVANILIKEGYTNPYIKGGAGDRGVDITINKPADVGKNAIYFVQCKRWASNVGAQPMQRLYAEREYHKAQGALCVTSSDFTSEGLDVASKLNIETWNGEKVMQLLQKHFPGEYYHSLLRLD